MFSIYIWKFVQFVTEDNYRYFVGIWFFLWLGDAVERSAGKGTGGIRVSGMIN